MRLPVGSTAACWTKPRNTNAKGKGSMMRGSGEAARPSARERVLLRKRATATPLQYKTAETGVVRGGEYILGLRFAIITSLGT